MKAQVEQRLTELRGELEAGQRALAELEARGAGLRATLLRIGGAVQVLEELLTAPDHTAADEPPLRRVATG